MLASDNTVRHSSVLIQEPQQDRAQETDIKVNDPYRWGMHVFDGLIPLQSSEADVIIEIRIYLLDLAEQLLGCVVFNIHDSLREPE